LIKARRIFDIPGFFLENVMKTVAIIPASGTGERFSGKMRKQYCLLDKKPLFIHALEVFEQAKAVHEIVLVLPADDVADAKKNILRKYGLQKITAVIAGGSKRQDSIRNGLASIKGVYDIVIVHDAVRPFVTEKLINDVIEAAKSYGAASAGVKANDTVKETVSGDMVKMTIPRDNLWLTQTPQAFKYEILRKAYNEAYKNKYYGTDDASLVENIGQKVKMVQSDYNNIKITTPEDMIIAKAFKAEKRPQNCFIGFGYDSHRFVSGRKLILGGVEIPFEKGLQGHSDADALVHAICDALLGAAGCGDIGRHFPDTDEAFTDISSLILLKEVRKKIKSKGFSVVNIDVTVVMEKPKIAAYAEMMIKNITRTLNVPEDVLNIKAKTNERMGFIGRSEGVAVFAVASVLEE